MMASHLNFCGSTSINVFLIFSPSLSPDNYIMAARQFLLRWSFYSSMIIR